MAQTLADSAKPYLDYLDKEMTIQGILAAFCVGVGAAAFDRVLREKTPSVLVGNLQTNSLCFVLAAIIAVMIAALLFYLERSELAWLHGQISLAVTRQMEGIKVPPDGYTFEQGLDIGDSWSLWNCYKIGLGFLAVAAFNALMAIYFSSKQTKGFWACLLIAIPFLVVVLYGVYLFFEMNKRDLSSAVARERPINNIRAAKSRRESKIGKNH